VNEFESLLRRMRREADPSFVEYFEHMWVDSIFHTWRYLDRPPTVPCTNSGLESVNATIKQLTDRKRLPMPKCIKKSDQIIATWSEESKPFTNEIEPSERIKKDGKKLARECNDGINYEMVSGSGGQ